MTLDRNIFRVVLNHHSSPARRRINGVHIRNVLRNWMPPNTVDSHQRVKVRLPRKRVRFSKKDVLSDIIYKYILEHKQIFIRLYQYIGILFIPMSKQSVSSDHFHHFIVLVDRNGDTKASDCVVLYRRQATTYNIYRRLSKSSDEEEVREYGHLVGKACAKRMLLYRN